MTLSERLRAYCIDFDGSQMKDLASPLDGMTCGEVREAADELDRLTARVAELETRLFAYGAMDDPPCFCCGYSGPGYFQPDKHTCAKRHHAALEHKHD